VYGLAHEFQERHHVLIVGDDAVEFLQQVEDRCPAWRSRRIAPAQLGRLSSTPMQRTSCLSLRSVLVTSYSVRHLSISLSL